MTNPALSAFADKIAAKGRITFGDIRRLERDILPEGVTSREEAELLLALDRAAGKADRAWAGYLAKTILEFVVWAEEPAGRVDDDAALWLSEALSSGGAPTKAGRLIARELAREAEMHDDAVSETGRDGVNFACSNTPTAPDAVYADA